LMNASSGWTTRYGHSSVAMQDGSIVLMGGTTFTAYNDVWRSTDNGATWMLMTANAGWLPRGAHSSVAMPDGSIVLMGGQGVGSYNDTWRSTDYGATWTPINMSSEWFARSAHTSVAMPDGSIVLMGGTGGGYRNDTWRFVPTGSSVQNPSHTYTSPGIYQVALQVYNAGGYNSTRKAGYINVSTPLPLIAGFIGTPLIGIAPLMVTFTDQSTGTPDTWNWTFGDGNVTNATDKNPTHSYLALGTYDVSLNVTNANGFSNITNKKGYITVTRFPTTKVGIFQPGGNWFLDMNNNGSWDGMPPDRTFSWGKLSGDIPITGDWNGDNITETGIFRPGGSWYLDMNNNGTWDSAPTDRTFLWGKQPGDIPITGDWNGDNITETGIFRPGGSWFFDMNNNGTWDSTPTDRTFSWGKLSGDIPITGDWNGDKITETGIFRRGIGFYLDMNNNGVWDGGDTMLAWGLQPSDIPVTGDWNGDGITETGIFRNGDWYLDINNNGHWDPGTDVIYLIGQPSDKPVTGKW
jgi:PKD repeat protein